jgi:hypothetical protein
MGNTKIGIMLDIFIMSFGILWFGMMFIWTLTEIYYGLSGIFAILLFIISFFYVFMMFQGIRAVKNGFIALKELKE